mgnify:CR=1 FL=1
MTNAQSARLLAVPTGLHSEVLMQRGDYLIRKVFFATATIIAVIITNFFLFRILPGDPVKMLIHSPRMTREVQEKIRADFGLDKPVWLDLERLREGDLAGAFDLSLIHI